MSSEFSKDLPREISMGNFTQRLIEKAREEQKNKAKKVLHDSGFRAICKERAGILHAEIFLGEFGDVWEDFEDIIVSDESAFIKVLWDQHVEDDIYSAKTVLIEALSNGSIIVRGNPYGSTVLVESEVKKESEKINALDKAIANPFLIVSETLEFS